MLPYRVMGERAKSRRGAPKVVRQLNIPLPVDPLYTLEMVCELVPFPSMEALYAFLTLHRHELPQARYMRHRHSDIRMMTGAEIAQLRRMRLMAPGTDRYHSVAMQAARLRRRGLGTNLDYLMQKAFANA